MPQPSHLHPEWGLLVPPRSVARTIRILMIASAVGVTAGAGIMSSLAERSSEEPAPVVVERTLVQPAAAVATPPSAPAKPQRIAQSEPAKAAPAVRSQSVAASLPTPHNQKKANKKHHAGARFAERGRQFTLMDDWYHAVGL